MRLFYLAVVILFAAAIAIFALQNLERVTMSFLGVNMSAPLAVVTVVVYVLGALTGGGLYALLKRSYTGAKLKSS